MIKVAIVGIGGMGFLHYSIYDKLDNAEVIAIADVRTEIVSKKTGNDKIPVYASLDELLEHEQPDMVDICTPSYLHAELSIKAMQKGIHVICEKPMALTTEDAEKIKVEAEKNNVFFMTAHVLRFHNAYRYLKHVVESGELGKLVYLNMNRISEIPRWSWEDWMRDVKKSGGTIMDLLVHDVDIVQSMMGFPDDICGFKRVMKENSDMTSVEMQYGDSIVTCTATWFNAEIPFGANYCAVFENGYVRLEDDGTVIRNKEKVSFDKDEKVEVTGINISSGDGYIEELKYFVNCILKNTQPKEVLPESSCRSIELMERIKRKTKEV